MKKSLKFIEYIENNAPNKLKNNRVLSQKDMPAGLETCNKKLKSRDGYCQQPGVVEFGRCKIHTGKEPQEAFEVFQKSMGLENALKLESLLKDTLNMNNELASAKVILTRLLEEWQRAIYVKKEYIENVPKMPDFEGLSKNEIQNLKELYKRTAALHISILETATNTEKDSYYRISQLIKTLIDGISKNKKLTEGNKFTMDIRQIREILKIQLEIMAQNCAGCPKLRNIIHLMKEKMKNVIFDPSLGKEDKKAAGAKAYADQLDMVEQLHDKMQAGEIIVE